MAWKRHWQYLKYVIRHKWFVFVAGRKLGVSWLALLHDNSKFMPDEWRWYARHFYTESGEKRTTKNSDGFYRDVPDDTKFQRAWLKHIRRNKHHPQHWVRVLSAQCNCMQTPTHVLMSMGIYPSDRKDVLLNDEDGARCMSCFGKVQPSGLTLMIQEMPIKYRKEMLADWIGAGLAQGTPNTAAWYEARGYKLPLGPETRTWIEAHLIAL